jgi:hypothetical protein
MELSGNAATSRMTNDAAIGAVAGVAATVAMTGVMEGAQRLGLMGDMPPWLITRRTLAKTGKRGKVPTPAQRLLATALHVGFGAVLGAVFEALEGEVRPPGPRIGHALAFAMGVWAVSYAGWVPALGLMPPPQRDQAGRQLTMLMAHAMFGAALLAAGRAAREMEEQE